jgi:hypothetical protein
MTILLLVSAIGYGTTNNAVVLDLKLIVDRSDKAPPKWVIDHRTEPN